MPELDFSKIFGETAASKASFTDENYLNGWGYLGSTPPPYQLFDYLQSLNDKKSKYLYDNINENKNNLLAHNTDSSAHEDIRQMFDSYLPLTGGTVNGPIVGNVKGNADTATDSDKLDGYHETSFLRYRESTSTNGEDTLWSQIGIKSYDDCYPEGINEGYNYGAVVSLPAGGGRLDIWYNHDSSSNGNGLWYRSGYDLNKRPWANLLDTVNYNKYVPTKEELGDSINAHNTDSSAHTAILNAIKAISGMSAYDTAPSKTIASIIPLLGFGGIVAQKLEANGYIKFANGVTIQWGDLTNSTGTFPIAFSTTVFFAVATSNTVNGTWSRPVIPMKPVTTLTGVSFNGYISAQEQANSWGGASFSGKYFCIGI